MKLGFDVKNLFSILIYMIASEETFLLLVVSNNNSLLTTHLPPVNLTGNTYKDMPIYGFSVN